MSNDTNHDEVLKNPTPAATGWICPRCGASNAPGVQQCPSCKPAEPFVPPPFNPPSSPWAPTYPWTEPPNVPYPGPGWPTYPYSYPWSVPVVTWCCGGLVPCNFEGQTRR